MTVHNEAKKEDIAKTVLMPGDPMRAKMVAEKITRPDLVIHIGSGQPAHIFWHSCPEHDPREVKYLQRAGNGQHQAGA